MYKISCLEDMGFELIVAFQSCPQNLMYLEKNSHFVMH